MWKRPAIPKKRLDCAIVFNIEPFLYTIYEFIQQKKLNDAKVNYNQI